MSTNARTDETAAVRETIERIRELNEQIIDAARTAGENYLDAYEQALGSIAGYQKQLARATPVDWLQRLIDAQATFTSEVAKLYASSARELMKR